MHSDGAMSWTGLCAVYHGPLTKGWTVSNTESPSTTWGWKRVKMSRRPQGSGTAARKGVRWKRFGRRDPHQWITVRLKYSGGAEGWVVVDGRGEVNAYHGATALLDLVLDINQARL